MRLGLRNSSLNTLKMPKIISYTPPWLSRPEPGAQLFASSRGTLSSPHREPRGSGNASNKNATGISRQYLGPTRTIARRGTEIFVAVDNEIRWSDLCMLKDNYDDAERTRKQKGRRQEVDNEEDGDNGELKSHASYRVCHSTAQVSNLLTDSFGRSYNSLYRSKYGNSLSLRVGTSLLSSPLILSTLPFCLVLRISVRVTITISKSTRKW